MMGEMMQRNQQGHKQNTLSHSYEPYLVTVANTGGLGWDSLLKM